LLNTFWRYPVSETEISRDGERRTRRLDKKMVLVLLGFCLSLALLIALNMN
jgi:hypothetical protein